MITKNNQTTRKIQRLKLLTSHALGTSQVNNYCNQRAPN